MPSLETALIFFVTALLIGIAPGPDIIFVLTQSALFGTRAGICTTLGLLSGLCVHTLAVALGVAVLFQTFPVLFYLLKCVGAAYLCWLAWLAFHAVASSTNAKQSTFPGYKALYKRGIIMNITNPKVCLFFLAFLPQFCNPSFGYMGFQICFFGILFILATMIVFFGVSYMGGVLATWFNNSAKTQIIIHRLAGIVFIALAAALLFTDGEF